MSKKPETALSAVSGLMEERRRFETWLAALEARRDATPARVYARVHADYTTRLEAVVSQLTTHTEGLRAELTRLTSQLTLAQEEQQQARDERAEAELRAHVGELTAPEWEEVARKADERIDQLVSRHADLETELRRTRELLSDAERPATPHLPSEAIPASAEATVAASVKAAAAAGTPASSEAVQDSAEGQLHVPSAKTGETPAVKKPADVEVPVAASGAAPTEVTPAELAAGAELMDTQVPPAQPPRRSEKGSFDELAFLNSVVEAPQKAGAKPVSAAPAAPVVPVPSPPRADEAPRRNKETGIVNLDATADTTALGTRASPRKGGTPMGANISGNHPIVLNEKAGEGARTLKCADCGAMNFPTEWYCEKCGAELASL